MSTRDTTPVQPSRSVGIELRHLRYFLAVVEELHFGRAAERLHIAQPPLSQAILKLEDELGLKLLDRTSRRVVVTAAGREFAYHARVVLSRVDLAVAEARRAGGLHDGLRVGCVPDVPLDRLEVFLEALAVAEVARNPQVTHLAPIEQVNRLRNGGLDVGIFHDVGALPGVDVQPLFAGEVLAAFLPAGHPLTNATGIGPDDLRGDVVLPFPYRRPALRSRLLKILEDAGYSFAGTEEPRSGYPRDVMLAVAEGHGVAIAPASLGSVSDAGSLVHSRPLEPEVTMPDTVIAIPEDPPRQLAAVLAEVRHVALRVRGSAAFHDHDTASDAGRGRSRGTGS